MTTPSSEALRTFAVFAEHLNFTRAAEELHISQPALHVRVRKLGEAVGQPLYRRVGRRLVLTDTGNTVARFARELDERLSTFLAELRSGPPDRPVVLAAGQGAFLYLLGDVVRRAVAGRRLRLLNLSRPRALAAVRDGRAHLGVAVLDVLPDDLESVLLAGYRQELVVPRRHPLAGRRTVSVPDLAGESLIAPPPERPHRVTIERAMRAAGVSVSIAVEAEGWPLMLHFVRLGVGVAVVNGCVRVPAGLVKVPIRDLPTVEYYAVHLPGRLDDPGVRELLDSIRDAVEPNSVSTNAT